MVMILPRPAAQRKRQTHGRRPVTGAGVLTAMSGEPPADAPGEQQEGEEGNSSGGSGGAASPRSWLQLGPARAPSSRQEGDAGAGPSSSRPAPLPATAGLTVTAPPPPPRRQTGFWFILRPAQEQPGGPSLPQLPRSYMRTSDGRMPISVVMRYIAAKLGLRDETQIEITCRGQRLPPAVTLQHVRDTIWRPVEAAAGAPPPAAAAASQPLMLQYSRRRS